MILDAKTLETIRGYCRDEAAFAELQTVLAPFLTEPPEGSEVTQRRIWYEEILQVLPDRVFLVSRNGDNLDFKGTQEDIEHGFDRSSVIGTNLRQFLPPEDAERCLAAIAAALNSGTLQTLEYQVPKVWEPGAGEVRDYEVRLVVSGPGEILAIERDITERKQAEAQYQAIFEAIQDGLIINDPDTGVVVAANPACCQMHGYTCEEFVGLAPKDFIHPDSYPLYEAYVETVRAGKPFRCRALDLRKDGTPLPIEVTGTQFQYRGKSHLLAVIRDISEQVEAEAALQQATQRQAELYQQVQSLAASLECQVQERTAQLEEKMQQIQAVTQLKDDFLYAVAHDLRTPIVGMQMVLKNLQNKATEVATLSRSTLERMIQSGDRQLTMINSLLEAHFSEIQGVTLQCEVMHLGQLLEALTSDLEPILLANRASLNQFIPPNLPAVIADATQIRRVFENLLTNALKHNPPGLGLTIKVVLEPGWIFCHIQDDGVGMTQAECDSIFDRYAQGKRHRRSTGIGLGLFLCRQIITAHGGQIGVTSAPNAGADFWFTLPLEKSAG